jgi:hypothetical protein
MMLRPGSLLIQMCDSPRPSEAPARVVIYEPLITYITQRRSKRTAEQHCSRTRPYHFAHSPAANIRAVIMSLCRLAAPRLALWVSRRPSVESILLRSADAHRALPMQGS